MVLKVGTVAAVFATLFCLLSSARGQVPQPTPTPDELIRVSTELLQTAVTVLDRRGRFVDGLKLGDFELKSDGRVVPIAFFENIASGGDRDRVARPSSDDDPAARTVPADGRRHRTVIFFLDDLHLSLSSIDRTRQMLLDFINKQMGDGDLIAIASASGKIGFLQQFTDNQDVLRAAVERIGHVPYVVSDLAGAAAAPMTEYNALTIERGNDPRIFDFYVGDCAARRMVASDAGMRAARRAACQVEVRNRARSIMQQTGAITDGMYSSFERLLTTAARLPGSKLAFFISDGFLADSGPRGRISADRIGEMTAKARKAGVVIYTIDAKGLVSGAPDATGSTPFDPDGRLDSANMRAIAASQDPLNALASDTGGRALRNQNYFEPFVAEAFSQTSRYYLIAWLPEGEGGKNEKSRNIEITLPNRSDLTVRSGKGFSRALNANPTAGSGSAANARTGADIKKAIADTLPIFGLPLDLSVVYMDVPGGGTMVTSSVEIPSAALSFGPQNNETAKVTVAGVVLDDHGKVAATFGTGLKVDAPKTADRDRSGVIYNYPAPLKSGLYQIRAAARDDRSGALGSAMQWIAVPDLGKRELLLSSLLLDVHGVDGSVSSSPRSQWSVGRRFAASSHLRFVGFVYNAAPAADGKPDLTARVQVKHQGVPALPETVKRILIDPQTDRARVPFFDDVDIPKLRPGRYDLIVSVEDHVTRTTASQHATFFVE